METYVSPSISDFAYGIGFSLAVMSVIFRALVFARAGEKWWKAPIVVYGDYVLVRLAKAPVAWFWGYALSLSSAVALITAGVLSIFGPEYEYDCMGHLVVPDATPIIVIEPWLTVMFLLVGIILLMTAFIFLALISDKVAAAFGKSRAFGIGLLLLNPIFYGILVVSYAEYQYADKDDSSV